MAASKRRNSLASENGHEVEQRQSKRARAAETSDGRNNNHEDDDDEDDNMSSNEDATEQNGQRHGDAIAEEEEEEGEQSGEDNIAEDDEETRALTQGVQRMTEEARGKVGKVALAGVIEQVELVNFMCHKLTTVTLGPQINFLVGHNGSGKSAVLTGITMALGGNAKATNRATKGSGLVMAGQAFAICSVRLKNCGPEAYQRELFGDSITVERRINLDQGGAYKIKNHIGKVVETKKAVLDAILDHFNIQVDNPMTVLTQDQSRQFLASSSARDKYTFFLRGTQLARLTEEYEVIRSNTEAMEVTMTRKKEIIPELKEEYRRAKDRAKQIEAAVDQQERIEQLKEELAWSYVVEVEDKQAAGRKIVEVETRLGPKLKEEIDKYRAQLIEAQEKVAMYEDALAEQQSTGELTAEIDLCQVRITAVHKEIKEINDHIREANGDMSRIQNNIQSYDQQLAAEEAKLSRDMGAEKAAVREAIQNLNDDIAKEQSEVPKLRHSIQDAEDESIKYRERYDAVKEAINVTQHEIQDWNGRILNLNRSKKDSLVAYGDKMPILVKAINEERGWRKRPIGPIGLYIKIKSPKYAKVLEAIFAMNLNAFIVDNEDDKRRLINLQRKHSASNNCPIIKQALDSSFDYSSAEPPQDVLTILRELEIKHEYANVSSLIEQVLIVSHHVEKAALVDQRADGDRLMRKGNRPASVETCFSADMFRLGEKDGGAFSVALDDWRGQRRLSSDVAQQILDCTANMLEVEKRLEGIEGEKRELDELLTINHRQKGDWDRMIKAINKRTMHKQAELEKLVETQVEEEPANVLAIQEAKKELEQELVSLRAQLEASNVTKGQMGEEIKPVVEEKERLLKELKNREDTARKIGEALVGAISKTVSAESSLQQMEQKKAQHLTKLAEMTRQFDTIAPILAERIEQASSICERPQIKKKRKSEDLQREIEQIQKTLKEHEKNQGNTIEEIIADVAIRRQIAVTAVETCRELGKLIQCLSQAYATRIRRWNDFRTQIAARAKMQFLFHLNCRGYTGKLHFDHDNMKLHLRVQTDDVGEGKSVRSRQKDAKALSGGEKSFSTICMLLTMWEAVGCPIRCLDEFDVFMDAVNRRVSMGMMIETAKSADSTQFILITPQDMGNIHWGPEVRVHKMRDPGRNQGTLQFTS